MNAGDEERLIARGLGPEGVLLLVQKQLGSLSAKRLRIIVNSSESAMDLVGYFESMGIGTETDRAGDDYHVIADLSNTQKGV